MRTPLSVATRGRITTVAKTTLAIATIGWLIIGSTPPPTPNIPDPSGGSGYHRKHDYGEEERLNNLRKDKEFWETMMVVYCKYRKLN